MNQPNDLRALVLYTPLPELWYIFNKVINLSPFFESGFTIMAIDSLKEYLGVSPVTQTEFWMAMERFLTAINSDYRAKRQAKLNKLRRK